MLTPGQGKRGGRRGVQGVMFAGHAHLKIGPHRAATPHLPAHYAVVIVQICYLPVSAVENP